MNTHRFCDGITRRDFVRVGAIGSGLTLADFLRKAHAAEAKPAKATSAVVVYLGGGPSHIDTFDPKPDAPAEIRGEFKPTDTNVPGVRICEHLPKLSKLADTFAIVRGVSHSIAAHELGTEYLSAGNRPIPSLVFPGYGAVVSKEIAGDKELPHFVAIPSTAQKAGYLGVRYAPLQTSDVPKPGVAFSVRGITLGNGLTVEEFEKRNNLLNSLDTTFKGVEADSKLIDGMDKFAHQAFDMIRSPKARAAFDVSSEKPEVARPFGEGRFGMSCLLAMRLIAAGVRFVTVSFSGWDTHGNNFKSLQGGLLPQLDTGLAALLAGLKDRGLLDTTTVYVVGEFGRTPKINDKAGRDHWPRAMTALLAGGGVKGGQVIGASDKIGAGPAAEAITPDQLAASFYHTLGIDHRKEYHTVTGRPVMIVREGSVIRPLFGG
ncbi:MAG: DUF1501 domain-containing protein [Planctomycetaceae bacterium]|nr:DUF1501 domain-containing protein [Planctomycetaceae bacterium]